MVTIQDLYVQLDRLEQSLRQQYNRQESRLNSIETQLDINSEETPE